MGRSFLKPAVLVILFIAALVADLRLAGTSPIIWVDTFNDENEVRQCVANDSCTLTGMSTSVPGQAHAVAWLELRTLLAWLGVGLGGVHLVVQVLNALAVVLTFYLATQLGGPFAGAAAAWLFMDHIEEFVRLAALHNISLLPFLGAVFVLACSAAIERPGLLSTALAALVGAVMTNVHLACALTGVSVVWVALMAPRRGWLLAGFGAFVFALVTVAVAPPTWHHNLTSLLERSSGHLGSAAPLASNAMTPWALLAVGAWVGSFAGRGRAWSEYRRRAHGAIAVIVPFLAVFLIAPRFGLNADPKYLTYLKAPCAIAAALPLAAVATATLRAMSERWVLRPLEQIAPFALALVIAFPRSLGVNGGWYPADNDRTLTIRDLTAVGRILHDENGWTVDRIVQHLKTPYNSALLNGLRQMIVTGDSPRPVAVDDMRSALLLVLETDELPDPLPSSWKIVSRSANAATVLVFMPSRIDWSTFVVCVQAAGESEEHCAESGFRSDDAAGTFVADMPPSGVGWHGRLRLRLPLRPAAADYTHEIFMPRMPSVSDGRIASPPGAGLQVDSDGRKATLSAPEPGEASPSFITLEWDIGSPERDNTVPPFFVEGDAATVRSIEAILRKRES